MSGFEFTIHGGKIKAPSAQPNTERLVIAGTALDGPKNYPVKIDSLNKFESVFGPSAYVNGYKDPTTSAESGLDAESSLAKAVQQAIAAGCEDVFVVRATGTYAQSVSAFGSKMTLKSLYPGRVYNEVSVAVAASGSNVVFNITQPSIKGGSFTLTFANTTTIGTAIDRINADSRNRSLRIEKYAFSASLVSALSTLATGTVTLSGGTNGTAAAGEDYASTLNGYYTALTTADTGTFDTLYNMNFGFNVATIAGLYLDSQVADGGSATTTSIASDFVVWLHKCSRDISPCRGVLGVKPIVLAEQSDIISYVDDALLATSAGSYNSSLRHLKAGYFLYTGWRATEGGETIDLGRYLQVVAGPPHVFSNGDIGNYIDSPHVAYAGFLTVIPPERAPIFVPIPGVNRPVFDFGKTKSNALINGVAYDESDPTTPGKGAYVTLITQRNSQSGPKVVYSDATAANRDDYFRQDQLLHLCNNVHIDLDYRLREFLGQVAGPEVQAAVEVAVFNVLEGYAKSGALKGSRGSGYDYAIRLEGSDAMLGIINIDIELAPSTTIRKFKLNISVRQGS